MVFVVAPESGSHAWVPSRVHCSQQFLTAHSERSTWPATRHVDQPAVFIPMIRSLSNSLNCEKCLLARLPGMFRLQKSSYNRWSLGLNPGEGLDICKCIVPSRHGGTLNSRRAASLVMLVEGKLSNWAVASAIDIIAPDTPTHFNHNAPSTIIDIGFAANFSHSNVFTVNELSSDHNPVIFDFVTNCQLPPLLQTLKTTNWIKFQEILHYNMPGNPTIDNLDQAVQNFSNMISDAINTSTSTRISKTSHLSLPINIRELIKTKNRFRKLWNNTRYPLYKREVNALVRQIRIEINEHKNRTWKTFFPR
ncbi:uncharacterized protein TNCV_3355661 [Trichonephila clavipes]|nr:uncharacterized protein TNCV_3355661 [Trichonephila clavipes]